MLSVYPVLAFAACLGVSSAAGGQYSPREFDPEDDLDLGVISDIEAFYELLGTNSSDWEDITPPEEYETVDVSAAEAWNSRLQHEDSTAVVARQDDTCAARTGWEWIVCENMPNSATRWAVGAAFLIWYAPTLLDQWLDSIAVLVYNGFNLQRRYRRQQGGGEGPARLKVRDELHDAQFIHFKIEEPIPGLTTRELTEAGNDARVFTEYLYDTEKHDLFISGVSGNFVGDSSAGVKAGEIDASQLDARQSNDYNILITANRLSNALTIAPPSCIRRTLRYYLDRSSERHQHSCQPIHNRGSWQANVGVHINQGAFNAAVPRACC